MKPTDRSELLDKAKKSNEAVQCGKFRAAIDMYTEAIALDLRNHVLISNRSAAFIHVKRYQESLNDAKLVIEFKPAWPKVRARSLIDWKSGWRIVFLWL